MIYLFYGDPFFTEQKIKKRKTEFALKYWAENIFQTTTKEFDQHRLHEIVRGSGLFTDKKLIIISWIPQNTTDKLHESTKDSLNAFFDYFVANRNSISEDNTIIFTTTTPDKKTRRAKFFLDGKDPSIKIIEHKADKKSMAQHILDQSDKKCWTEAAEFLVELCNQDMYLIDNELHKILSYIEWETKKNNWESVPCTLELISSIVSSTANIDVWSFLDGIIIDNNLNAYAKLIKFAHDDNNEFQFLWLLYRSIGGILGLIDCREHGISHPSELAKKTKLPPFTISRYANKKQKILDKKKQFQTIYHSLVNIDYKLKTGLLPAESFWVGVMGALKGEE